jgi:hypothetical protein
MYKFAPALLIALLLCGFGYGRDSRPAVLPQPVAMDMTQATIDMYINGTVKAPYWVTVHKDPKVGQYWETAMTMYGATTTSRWQVASVDGDSAVIENQMKMDSQFATSDYVVAYKVNLKAEAGEVNVTKAWIGRPEKEGTEVKIMDKPAPQPKDPSDNASFETAEEEFKDMELAGKKWSGKKITMSGRGWSSTSWVATDGWFGGVIKTEAAGTVNELKATGDDAKALLTLPKDKEEKKDDNKDDKEEKKDDKDK